MGAFNDLSGKVFGEITVLEKDIELSKQKGKVYWKCRCSCGREKSIRADGLKKIQTCGECSKDLLGKRFGLLVVIEKGKIDINGHRYWKCQCDCGNIKEVNGDNLRRGLTQSCGCLHSKTMSERAIDLTNQRFGKLTVIKKASSLNGRIKWLCQCECGNFIEVFGANLKSGHTTSCGCIHSLGEYKIRDFLLKKQILFKTEFVFSELPNRRFDFAVFNNNGKLCCLIEFDGKQHYSYVHTWHKSEEDFLKSQLRDKEKNDFCLKNKIKLIRVPYWELENIEKFLEGIIKEDASVPDMEEAQEIENE